MIGRRRRGPPILAILFLFGALAVLWWGLGFAERQREAQQAEKEEELVLDERGELGEPEGDGAPASALPSGDFRAEVIAYAELQAATLLPGARAADPIERFWFTEDREVYVEYRREGQKTSDRMAFVVVTGDPELLVLTRQSLYGASEAGGWELIEGQEVLFNRPLRDLYERDTLGNWTKRN